MNSPLLEVVILRTIGTMATGPGCLPRKHPIHGFFPSARWLRVSERLPIVTVWSVDSTVCTSTLTRRNTQCWARRQLFPDVFHPWVVEATGVSDCRLRTWKGIEWGASPERFRESLPGVPPGSRRGSRWRKCGHVPESLSVPWLPPLHYSLFDSNLPFAGTETVLISITKEVLITEATADTAGLQWGQGLSVIHRVSAAIHDASQLGPDPFFICLKPFPLGLFYYSSLLPHWWSELTLHFTGKKIT